MPSRVLIEANRDSRANWTGTQALVEEIVRLRARVAELEGPAHGGTSRRGVQTDGADRWAADVGRIFSQTLDATAVAAQVALGLRTLLGAEASLVYSLDGESGNLRAIAVSGTVEQFFES